jgi:hypothetical protein
MDGVDVCDLGGTDDAISAQIAVGALGAADANRFVSQLHMERLDVCFGVDREGFDAHFTAGSNDAECDFTAIGDEDLLNHKTRKPLHPPITAKNHGEIDVC